MSLIAHDEAVRIYEMWHKYARGNQVEALVGLYAPDAVLESPLVPAILDQEEGVLRGRSAIEHFLAEGTKRRPNPLVRWYRTGRYFFADDTLVWEYPRQTPDGDQIDIVEWMELADGKIQHHRIYWGWFGCKRIASALLR
jgi:hypothetical protein